MFFWPLLHARQALPIFPRYDNQLLSESPMSGCRASFLRRRLRGSVDDHIDGLIPAKSIGK